MRNASYMSRQDFVWNNFWLVSVILSENPKVLKMVLEEAWGRNWFRYDPLPCSSSDNPLSTPSQVIILSDNHLARSGERIVSSISRHWRICVTFRWSLFWIQHATT